MRHEKKGKICHTSPSRHHIEAKARARFSIVHSTGKVETHEYAIGVTTRKVGVSGLIQLNLCLAECVSQCQSQCLS